GEESARLAGARLARVAAGIPAREETRLLRKDGSTATVLIASGPVRDHEGSITGALGMITDVTERHAIEEQYRMLAESSPQIVWSADASRATTYVNERWIAYTGIARDAGVRDGWTQAVHPEDLGELLAAWAVAAERAAEFEVECRVRRGADGAYRWHLTRARPRRGPDGAIAEWLGTVADVDATRRAADAMARHARTREIVNRASEALTTTLELDALLGRFAELLVRELGEEATIRLQDGLVVRRGVAPQGGQQIRSTLRFRDAELGRILVRGTRCFDPDDQALLDELAVRDAVLARIHLRRVDRRRGAHGQLVEQRLIVRIEAPRPAHQDPPELGVAEPQRRANLLAALRRDAAPHDEAVLQPDRRFLAELAHEELGEASQQRVQLERRRERFGCAVDDLARASVPRHRVRGATRRIDVGDRAEPLGDRAVRSAPRSRAREMPAIRAVGAAPYPALDLELRGPLRGDGPRREQLAEIFRMDGLRPAVAHAGVARDPGVRDPALVDVGRRARRIGAPDDLRRRFREHPVLLFDRVTFRDVGDHPERAGDRALVVAHRAARDEDRRRRTVLAQQPRLLARRDPGRDSREARACQASRLLVHEVVGLAPVHLVGGVAEDLGDARVDVARARVAIDDPHALLRRVDQAPVERLARGEVAIE